ncbi:MAG: NAD(P)/FAD-dependent oxidoreductase [Candidatus Latescibacteria bacterium]|jgi:nitrite reductase (NADH) large subunit|nr:NAD(P)/FAD-dependent oxidoreductase [Candidatus Latescibacterota bacterium]
MGIAENKYSGKIIIIGASAAGISAAKEIRAVNNIAKISIITEENHMPYYRPYLTEYIKDNSVKNRANFNLNKEEWYKKNNISIILGEKVIEINHSNKTIKTDKDIILPFDKLILANGSKPFVPIKGSLEKENVFAIRTLDDAKTVHNFSNKIKKAIVIGGGLLGLEIANALIQKNIDITIVELVERILPMQLDSEGSYLLESIIKENNIKINLGVPVELLIGENKITSLRLKSGEEVSTDMIIFSIGVKANIELAKGCGIKTNSGIIVNEKMETNIPDIYACGDVTEFGRCVALWMPAVKQGRVAGLNVIGNKAVFKAEEYPAVLNSFGTRIYSIGDICRNQDYENYITMQYKIPEEKTYKKLFFKDDKLVGGILIGDIKKSTSLNKGINSGLHISAAIDLIK